MNNSMNIEDFIKKIKDSKPSFLNSECSREFLLKNYNYILTDKAKERLDKLYTYISNGIPVLLEGETGCSKTLSEEIICKFIYEKKHSVKINPNNSDNDEDKYIKYNLSADVKISDLMQKLMSDKTFLSGIKIVDGPFYKAFKNGIPLILDEINLASEEVLQCIEDALDSKVINIEITSIGKIHQVMKEGFCLIATQNPNKDNYANKRQNLSQGFLSHFQVIKFPNFEIKELKEIAEELFKSFNGQKNIDEKDKNFISDLIDFHNKWASNEMVKNDFVCFTIREITASIKAYIDGGKKDAFQTVKVIYASRYKKKEKNELLNLLGKYESFKDGWNKYKNNKSIFKIPDNLKNNIYENEIIKEVFESCIFSLNKGRNIIIIGEDGLGKSQIAKWVAEMHNGNNNNYVHFICTEETKCSDLIGYHSPKKEEERDNENILEWKEGFLTDSIKNGKIVILDNLQEANSIVTERLNSLLDFKYDKNIMERKFDIPENPLENSIIIHKNFRIIGVCNIEQLMKMSPAFLNRFDIITLENQLEDFSNEKLNNLVKVLIGNIWEKKELNKAQEKEEEEIFDELDNIMFANKNDTNEEYEEEEEEDENSKISSQNKIEKMNIHASIFQENNSEYISKKLSTWISEENINKEEKKNTYSIKNIARFCYSLKLILNMEEFKDIKSIDLIDFIFDLLFTEKQIQNKEIKEILLNLFREKKQNLIKKNKDFKDEFIFEKKENLENFVAIVYASFLIHLHLYQKFYKKEMEIINYFLFIEIQNLEIFMELLI